MNIGQVLRKKREGAALSDEEIEFFIRGVTDGSVADYQAAAFLMAVAINGMNERETLALTLAMRDSGAQLDLSDIENSCDKHSTGGVGDTTTLIVAPIVAACGLKVAKISGRGLGHTGGTVDKLEAVKGVSLNVTPQRFKEIVKREGLCVIEQTGGLVPADKKLYALRDVTETVDSLPLIVSSVMSKKLAAGAQNIVLDVKCGSGAFMKNLDDAEKLASAMVRIGKAAGRGVCALITDMDRPLSGSVGNALEVEEAIEVLKGERGGKLREVSLELSARLIRLASGADIAQCRQRAERALNSGEAYSRLLAMLTALGAEQPLTLARASAVKELKAPRGGFVRSVNAEKLGHACLLLGAGRQKKEDVIDYGAGIRLKAECGDRVQSGDALMSVYAASEEKIAAAEQLLISAVEIGDTPPENRPAVLAVIE